MTKLIVSNENLQKIISEFVPGEHGDIKEIGNKEGNSRVFSIGNKYVLRIGEKENKYVIEHEFIKLAQEIGVKTPKLIIASEDLNKYPFTFSFQEKLAGESLDKLPEKSWQNIFSEVSAELAKLYSIKMEGFGVVDVERFRRTGELVGEYSTWKGFIYDLFADYENAISKKINEQKKNNFGGSRLSSDQIAKLVEIEGRIPEIKERIKKSNLDLRRASLLHGDLQRLNFIVNNGHLSGIIDFEHVMVGDPLFDIALASIMPGGEFYSSLLDKSGVKMDEDRFNLYRLLIAFGKIKTRYVKHDYLHDYPEILDFVLEELDK